MDLVVGTHIKFTEAVFIGKYPKGKYSHDRTIEAIIEKDSYGQKRGQHTFSLKVISSDDDNIIKDSIIKRNGRNLYKNCKVIMRPDNKSLLKGLNKTNNIIRNQKNELELSDFTISEDEIFGDLDY